MPAQQNLYVAHFPAGTLYARKHLEFFMAEDDPDAIKQAEVMIRAADRGGSYELYRVAKLGLLYEGHYGPDSDQS